MLPMNRILSMPPAEAVKLIKKEWAKAEKEKKTDDIKVQSISLADAEKNETNPPENFLADRPVVEYPDIADIIRKNIISSRRGYHAPHSIWASEAGHECERYLVYQQCNHADALTTDDNLLLIFNEGENQENQLLLDLQQAKIKVKDLQLRFEIKSANISGKLDTVVEIVDSESNTHFAPCEIKSMSPNVFDSIQTVEDLKKYPWTSKYYGQMQLQLKNDNWEYPFGYFLCKNKSSGQIKVIKDFDGSNVIKFNPEYWNELIAKGKRVKSFVNNNKHIDELIEDETDEDFISDMKKQKKYPDRIKYDLKVCGTCKYNHICIVNLVDPTTAELSAAMKANVVEYIAAKKERETYSEADKRYKTAHETLKKLFPQQDNVYATDEFILQTKMTKGAKPYIKFDIKELGNEA